MANELEVDADGLRSAAGSSAAAAAALTEAVLDEPAGSKPSSVGVAAVNAALTAARGRQSSRITSRADDMLVSAARYDTADGGGSDAIRAASV
ncbi:hypothetical protein [Mycolicibacterium sp. F2034L]|uniref:hypothetical protein n=1 Tax=Mycolicibacterium sp. F2034L TaxID=2926422 RepID=UPI001FF22A9D|nr:hypothetical protein [Mycolicibacterium sp. F2034L]MCK0177616.1 hypothetical protein [Mycolicibacterium sp. F2034L]